MFSVLGLLLAAYFYWSELGKENLNLSHAGGILAFVSMGLLFLPSLIVALSWGPLQRIEQKVIPRLTDLFRKDSFIRFFQVLPMFAAFLGFLLAIDLISVNFLDPKWIFPLWIVLLGFSLDCILGLCRRVLSYLDPWRSVSLYSHEAHKCIQNDREAELCDWIDGLSEIALRALERSNISICHQACQELQQILRGFLESSKSITHHAKDAETKALGISDKVNYTLFFLLERLEMIHHKAVSERMETVCSMLITVLSKIVVSCAKFDVSLATYPLPFLGRFSLNAQKAGMKEVGHKASVALLEIAKIILTEIDVTYAELQEPFYTLINQMHEITKEMFRQDKSLQIKVLIQPFAELKKLFQTEKMATHPDTGPIVNDIDRVLAEFDALEAVMKTMPPMPDLSTIGV